MKKRTLLIFALIPTILATVSAFHLESMVRLGNHIWLSIPVAVAYELANLIIILLIVNSKNVNKFYVFIAFIIIIFMQLSMNVLKITMILFHTISKIIKILMYHLHTFQVAQKYNI